MYEYHVRKPPEGDRGREPGRKGDRRCTEAAREAGVEGAVAREKWVREVFGRQENRGVKQDPQRGYFLIEKKRQRGYGKRVV